jgi:HD superfamily phosphohydrolase
MLEFSDLLYGRISLPDWLGPFLRIPEFIRLRGVRLSNVDSFEFKDFSGPNRWDHGVAVSYLATRCARAAGFSESMGAQLVLAALLHDVATPPFAHTAEYVFENFDHELETQNLLTATSSEHSSPDLPIYLSELPRFRSACLSLGKRLRVNIDPDEIAAMITGGGELGFLVSGSIDLDNADNVTRACMHLGIEVDRAVPLQLSDWLATQKTAPTALESIGNEAVQKWLGYRREMYRLFFEASEQETGRQAFLQHLLRRALRTEVPRSQLLWNTDDGLLRVIEELKDEISPPAWPGLREVVTRYKLMEPTQKIVEIDIAESETLRALRMPQAATWIEEQLSTPDLEPLVMVSSRRFGGASQSLLPPAVGAVSVFKLGGVPKYFHLPVWLREDLPNRVEGQRLLDAVHESLSKKIASWVVEQPWRVRTPRRDKNAVRNLHAIGDWSFRLSKNEALHAYPGTFVHAIPAALINALGLKGALILDPFGGTGQTAVEAIKNGCRVVSADSNSVATLVAKAKLTYLSTQDRKFLRSLSREKIAKSVGVAPPASEMISDWHHPATLDELCRIKGMIELQEATPVSQFMMSAFSAILPSATARRGKEHGFFADNTPLGAAFDKPPYQDAIELFLHRLSRNLGLVEKLYAGIEANDSNVADELARASVVRADARTATSADYGISPNSVDAVITSPPYLCMADYALGQRLTYYWFGPEQLTADFKQEIGPRRLRSNPTDARRKYVEDLARVAGNAASLIKDGGYFAAVLGAPVAAAFASGRDLHDEFDELMGRAGFKLLWKHWRAIHWHRNHGYQRLKQERISVHVLER